jgi:tetratricopeptide (TPR) repeat protein
VAGGYKKTAMWIADLIFLANNRAQRPSVRLYRLLKDAYAAIGTYNRAISACKKVLKLDPNDTSTLKQLKELQRQVPFLPEPDQADRSGTWQAKDGLEIPHEPPTATQKASHEDTSTAAASLFFAKAADAAAGGNYDYAIDLYIDGLRRAPEAVEEGHLALARLALQRQAKGGKKPGVLEKARLWRAKGPLEQMLAAEYLFAKDPSHMPYAEAMLKAAVEGGFTKTADWIANLIFQTNNALPKPSFQVYILLKDAYKFIGQLDKAVVACQRALRLRPDDAALAEEFKNLSAELTVARGRYDTSKDFRGSIKDAERQALLYGQDRVIKTEDWRKLALEQARKDYAANPDLPKNILNLANCLADMQTKEAEDQAIALLEQASVRLKDYGFKHRAGQIRLKQLNRLLEQAKAELEKDPADPQKKANVDLLVKQTHDFELEYYRLAVQNYPTDLRLKYEYALRLARDGLYDQAIPLFQEAQKDPARRIASMNQVGLCFMAKGWLNDAADVLTNALNELEIKDDAMGKELRYNLGCVYQQSGQHQKALEIFRKIAQEDYGYKDVSARIEALRQLGA